MVIDDEKKNYVQKISSTVFDINSIAPEQAVNSVINLGNQENQDSNIENVSNIQNNPAAKEKGKVNFGQKRKFQEFSSQADWENPMANQHNNFINFRNLLNNNNNKHIENFNWDSNNNIFNKNILGFSANENPFVPKKLTKSADNDLQNAEESHLNQAYSLVSEIPNQGEKNVFLSLDKKTIPFQNNFKISSASNINIIQSSSFDTNNSIYPSNDIDTKNIQSNVNLQDPNQAISSLPYNQNQNFFGVFKQSASYNNLSFPNFGQYNNTMLGIKPNFNNNEEKDAFSKAMINNKIYIEDNNDFIQVGQQQKTKKPNYREGLFDKTDNSALNILKNNFGVKNSSNQNRNLIDSNQKNAYEGSEGDENKENTDDDQEEIRIIEETLQRYLDEDKIINDKKLKISVIRKVAPYYKVLTQQNNEEHFTETVEKIKTIINEERNNIVVLLNYEYLKNLREKVFQKFCKMINKFFSKLNENKVKEFGGENYNIDIPEILKERLKNIFTKINDYFEKNKELE